MKHFKDATKPCCCLLDFKKCVSFASFEMQSRPEKFTLSVIFNPVAISVVTCSTIGDEYFIEIALTDLVNDLLVMKMLASSK